MVATVKINANRNSGQVQGTSEIGKLTKVMTDFKNAFVKNTKLSQSGLGGGGLLARGGLFGLLAGATGAVFGAEAERKKQIGGPSQNQANDITGFDPMTGSRNFDFDPATMNGEDVFVKTNSKTGEILEILTKREAEEQGLLDKTGKLSGYLDDANGIWDEQTKDAAAIGEKTILTKENLDSIKSSTDEAATLWGEIVTTLREKKVEVQRISLDISGNRAGTGNFGADIASNALPNLYPSVNDYLGGRGIQQSVIRR
jgi:hypothetical protein